MSSTPTFEDRLLDELKREIALRGSTGRETAPAGARTPERGTRASVRRLLTVRRITVAAIGCAMAALATVVAPGSPAAPAAYAVERHGDGSVTLTVKDQHIGVGAQRELAVVLRRSHIAVIVDVLAPGYVCRGEPVVWGVGERGARMPVLVQQFPREISLRPGNVLVFENLSGHTEPHRVDVFTTRSGIKPCVPVKPTAPDNS
ncbi:hypothetical protein [Streptomyces triticiradicis]|uniref:Uncharacterized protein n=1 Tax=Streptomyces triticiradicis TaxID=2651189 RepID=A0A7J5DBV5_9ACTN|nr:hypothetical protein [Streptomyces triticiradicis]KAB1985989.1 hypothetical protein F8144_24455 [Streptomyces triticiradicis]